MKLRPTAERLPSSMLLEPPYTLNGSHFDHSLTPRWRHMKCVVSLPRSFPFITYSSSPNRHACGVFRDTYCPRAACLFIHKVKTPRLSMASPALTPGGTSVPPMTTPESCVILKMTSAPKPNPVPGVTSQGRASLKICNGNPLLTSSADA